MPQLKKVDSGLSAELNQSLNENVTHRMHQILESLDQQERTALEQVMAKMHEKNLDKSLRSTPQFSYKWLAETLTKHGHPIKKNQVRHFMVYLYPKNRGKK